MTTTPANVHLDYILAPSVLVIAAPGRETMARDAATLADLRVVGVADFHDAADALAMRSGPNLITIEAAGADPGALLAALGVIEVLAQEREVDVVVALSAREIDTTAGHLLGRGVVLLCEPTVADRVAAYRLARGVRTARLHDATRDPDARLEQLNAEVARFADTLARLAADSGRAATGGMIRDSAAIVPHDRDDGVYSVAPMAVRDAIRARRMRSAYFAEDLFADPAWDILLDLFAADLEGRRVSVSSLCIAAAVPGTTALRWIGSMVESGLLQRGADAQDRRRAFITLSPVSRQGMQRYFDAIRRARLAPA